MGLSRDRVVLFAAAVCAATACAPKQTIPLDCIPKEVVVYVDGERLDEIPPELDLRSDQPHTIFLKGPEIKSELVVLHSEDVAGRWMLSPASVCVHPRLIEVRRELEFQIDPGVSAAPSKDAPELDGTVDVTPPPDFPLNEIGGGDPQLRDEGSSIFRSSGSADSR